MECKSEDRFAQVIGLCENSAGGSIDNRGIAESLQAFLDQAAAALDRENTNAANNKLNAFIKFANAQAGKHIDAAAAQTLIDMAQYVIDGP